MPVMAQSTTLVVSVADAHSGKPLMGAQVRLPTLGRLARADWLGETRISAVPRGRYEIVVRALGYAPSDIMLDVAGDSVGAVFMLEPVATGLDTVRVFAPVVSQRLEPFEMRRRMGIGRFLAESALVKEGTRSLANVLVTHLPGLRLVPDDPASFMTVKSSGTSGNIWDFDNTALGTCKVDIYLDGVPLIDHLESVFPADLAGVELYNMSSAPAQYRQAAGIGSPGGRYASCKVLLLWTKF